MDKALLVKKIIEKLEAERQVMAHAAAVAREAATHEESIAEDKYDTRGLEASYLAGGQARRAAELDLIIAAYQSLQIKKFGDSDPIQSTALIELENENKKNSFFLGPKGGGTSVELEGRKVQVVTPESRLGAELLGKHKGDVVEIKSGNHATEWEVLGIE